ncbi:MULTISPECIES: asparagine synthase (glutamine-hydrolyzing) [Clostridiaceae]|uniref:asparagine synthase (glutamine-hydrolyzing) n=1 Tax=Clostridiaceae TaxID=31979 RepID=UPI0005543038|nr:MULTISPECIES: asparagine synthase (glutamine-hydrolyzing) [Clostridiaceae]
MCGFVGFFTNEKVKNTDIENIRKMNSKIQHRGPDDEGIYYGHNILLVFRRLSIIALDSGKQPFSYNNDNYHIIFNGEIYNYIELKEKLINEGLEFSTDTEAEVILALYKHKGRDFVKELRGMFAFAIWDEVNKKLFCARDPFGIKPFYYIDNDNSLYFASELKSFTGITDKYSNEIRQDSLHNYLTFQFVPEPNTMFNDIKLLESGCILEKSLNEKINITKYWYPKFNPIIKDTNEKISEIKTVLENSVKIHMRSDVPVGCFLSGGIDSTIIALLAKKFNPHIKTFTIGFNRNGYSEVDLAKETAEELELENISRTIDCDEFIKDIEKIVWHMDSPVADPSLIPIYYISKEARKHVKVILSGEGSDELFGGYGIYHEPQSLKMFSHIPASVKRALKHIAYICPEGVKGKSFIERGCTPLEERYVGNAKIFKDYEKMDFLKNYNKAFTYNLVTKPLYEAAVNYDDITKMQYIDINTWLKGDILIKSDRMSMANSLELRVPFLDKEVFKVASSLMTSDKVHNSTTKYLLRETFKDDLPMDNIIRKKLGYPVPIRHWLKNELYSWAESTIKNSMADEYINKENTLKMLKIHKTGHIDYSRKLWTIITFILWHKVFIEEVSCEAKAI